jgi:hypothetical protein
VLNLSGMDSTIYGARSELPGLLTRRIVAANFEGGICTEGGVLLRGGLQGQQLQYATTVALDRLKQFFDHQRIYTNYVGTLRFAHPT